MSYYLSSNRHANSLHGDGVLVQSLVQDSHVDVFKYDPLYPVPSHGGNACCTANAMKGGSFNQREMEARNDILAYTSETPEAGVEVSGFVESTLYVSSDAKDTAITIKFDRCYPDGRAYNLDDTIQRLRYREVYEKEVFMEKGQIYQVEMTPMFTSNFFNKGLRIGVEISSSNFPRFDRNLNTGGNNYDEIDGVIATNGIHHSSAHPSQIRLPIVSN